MSAIELDFYLSKFKGEKSRADLMRKIFNHVKKNSSSRDEDIKWEIREALIKNEKKLPEKFKYKRVEVLNG